MSTLDSPAKPARARATRIALAAMVIATLVVDAPCVAFALPPGKDGTLLNQAADALQDLRVEEADKLVKSLAASHPRDPDVLYERAVVLFHQGDYSGAARLIDESAKARRGAMPPGQLALKKLVATTRDATASFVTSRSDDGRFVVRHAPGRDEVLVPYAIETMAAAERVLASQLGYRMPGPVRLEIYPSPASLAAVSTLTEEEIERTGTIALCKWDRLMITSPRALIRGYPWMDTIAHEYVHLVLSRASRDRAPVWLQEGIAKFLERRWRGNQEGLRLEPASLALLRQAAQQKKLIPFQKLHPSIARLPSQEDAVLAFAQVSSFIDVYVGHFGAERLRDAIKRVSAGVDAREALAAAADVPWSALELEWHGRIEKIPAPTDRPPRVMSLKFRKGNAKADESSEVQVEQARRHLRLGDLLWDRGHAKSATVEYTRAHSAAPDDPVVASRLGRAALSAGDPSKAIAALEETVTRYPDHAPIHAILGSARVAMGDAARARSSLTEAIRLNPFDPQPHCDMAVVASNERERKREGSTCRTLGGKPTP